MKLELLTNATVVDDAITFVSERTRKERLISEKEESQTIGANAAAHTSSFLIGVEMSIHKHIKIHVISSWQGGYQICFLRRVEI
jgi:hypothetical protein